MKMYVFSGSEPKACYEEIYEKSFLLWKKEWEKTYRHDFKEEKTFFADEFLRQSHWITLCNNSEPIGMVSLRKVSFKNPITPYDSWFRFFPTKDLQPFVRDRTDNCLISSNFVVKEEYRKSSSDFKVSECIAHLNSLFALQLGFDIHFGCSNNSRSVDKIVANTGATIMSKGIPYKNGIELNSFYWTEANMKKTIPQYPLTSIRIFNEKIDYTNEPEEKYEYTAKVG